MPHGRSSPSARDGADTSVLQFWIILSRKRHSYLVESSSDRLNGALVRPRERGVRRALRPGTLAFVLGLLAVSCGSSGTAVPTLTFNPDAEGTTDGGSSHGGVDGGGSHGGIDAGGGGHDSGQSESLDAGLGTTITCPAPGSYTKNGGACGTERWNIKTGTDPQAPGLSLEPTLTTIAALDALPAAGGGNSRESPTETTLYELRDVTLTELKIESDSDYHLVISDGTKTMIVEIPYPTCTSGSPWTCFVTRARSEIDALYSVTSSPQHPARVVTVRGFGFFDVLHGQTGVAPNGIELHPTLQICFGQGCTPS